MIPPGIIKYLDTRGSIGPWTIAGIEKDGFEGAVVIPSLAESETLFKTLSSLAQNPEHILRRVLILVVVNHRQDSPLGEKRDNHLTLRRLAAKDPSCNLLRLGWVDASSHGLELPVKKGGVGLARKIGFDLALPLLNYTAGTPLLISLDADTLVQPAYLPALFHHFQKTKAWGAVIPFCHQPGATPELNKAIQHYELFLRAYVLGLSLTGSPYAFHTIGSAMAFSAQAYARTGGMNIRVAGEDFYFLQHLARTGGLTQVQGTMVYPSARASNRVPFGTGRSISNLIADQKDAVLFYQKECFQILKDWLAMVEENAEIEGEELRSKAQSISVHLGDYLDRIQLTGVWKKLKKNYRDRKNFLSGFHGWFDGLKTMKLIHFLSAGPFPRKGPEEVLPKLWLWAGLKPADDLYQQLALLRGIQNHPIRFNRIT